ncbi:hypothetical protein, partial [Nitrosomonas sp. Nm33]|uniref:hypothetical protein n=1 Tax=Nitrosomonas sp. Nm33 TaxID=133724 RepID=UPI001C40B299
SNIECASYSSSLSSFLILSELNNLYSFWGPLQFWLSNKNCSLSFFFSLSRRMKKALSELNANQCKPPGGAKGRDRDVPCPAILRVQSRGI